MGAHPRGYCVRIQSDTTDQRHGARNSLTQSRGEGLKRVMGGADGDDYHNPHGCGGTGAAADPE